MRTVKGVGKLALAHLEDFIIGRMAAARMSNQAPLQAEDMLILADHAGSVPLHACPLARLALQNGMFQVIMMLKVIHGSVRAMLGTSWLVTPSRHHGVHLGAKPQIPALIKQLELT
jgi:hypothetical protein